MDSGITLHRAGRLAEAEGIYRQVLAIQPANADAWHLLGIAALQRGQFAAAEELIRRSIAITAEIADTHNNLGHALQGMRRFDEAAAAHRRAIELKPNHADAQYNLANALREMGQLDEAINSYREAIRLNPVFAEAYNNLGNALKAAGRLPEAIDAFRQALRIKPEIWETYNNLGTALRDSGQIDEAIALFRRSIDLKPDYGGTYLNLGVALNTRGRFEESVENYRRALQLMKPYAEIYNNLGNALNGMSRFDEAIAAYQEAIRLTPEFAMAHNNMGNAFKGKAKLEEAIACYRRAIEIDANYVHAHDNLGSALKDVGQLAEAILEHRKALTLDPHSIQAHDNLIAALHYCATDAKMIYEETRRWNEMHARPLLKFIQPHTNSRDPDRPLRIGYVSPDFREHPIGRFMLALLSEHDADRFEIFCYADVQRADHFTAKCRRHAGHWREIMGVPDEQAASLVRDDRIDILVDLAMHMARNRLPLFARKPAPVQATYLAYCSTTGMDAMDYRLSDPYLDPPNGDESFYSEKSIRLDHTYWCYAPIGKSPDVAPLPALSRGEVTFGCLNNFCKVSPDALDLWMQLLHAVPKSRLLLHAYEGSHRQPLRDQLSSAGLDPRRLDFADRASLPEYLNQYNQIDIALDPFPFNGATTTCDALWMGVPVVALAGPMAIGRAGASVLNNAGLSQLVAQTPQEYLRIAADLAGDLPRLAKLRGELRGRIRASPLMDAPKFARSIEAAYRQMWRAWCSNTEGSK